MNTFILKLCNWDAPWAFIWFLQLNACNVQAYVYVCVCISKCMCEYLCVCIFAYNFCVYFCVCICVCAWAYVYICVYVYMNVNACFIYVNMYVFLNISLSYIKYIALRMNVILKLKLSCWTNLQQRPPLILIAFHKILKKLCFNKY